MTGAWVLDRTQVAMGPNNGYIDNSVVIGGGGDGPKMKSVIGDRIAIIGAVRKLIVSKKQNTLLKFTISFWWSFLKYNN